MIYAKCILTVLSLIVANYGWLGMNANMKNYQCKKCGNPINNEYTPSILGSQGVLTYVQS
jgi:hypothetical protein